jgi:hypothetical protein
MVAVMAIRPTSKARTASIPTSRAEAGAETEPPGPITGIIVVIEVGTNREHQAEEGSEGESNDNLLEVDGHSYLRNGLEWIAS